MSALISTSKHYILAVLTVVICIVTGLPFGGPKVLRFLVPHDAQPGHLVTQLSHYGVGSFKVLNKNLFSDYFKIDDAGNLLTTKDISSLVGKVSSLEISDLNPASSQRIVVHMHVYDGHSTLVFPKQAYAGHVREHEPIATAVQGLDDLYIVSSNGKNKVTFSMISGDTDKFSLKQSSVNGAEYVKIFTREIFDRSTKSDYDFIIQAQDDKGGVAVVNISVVVDAGISKENVAPKFESSKYRITIPDTTSPESLILHVKATDPDHNQVTYRFLHNPGPNFRIDKETGAIRLGYNHVKPGVYSFHVVATNGDRRQSDRAKVTVVVTSDSPLTSGVILRRSRRAVRAPISQSVTEDKTGILLTIKKTDAAERFTIVTPFPEFTIDFNTGSLSLKSGQKLDHETKPSYTIKVKVTKDTDPSFSDTVDINLSVTDVNDTPPTFTNIPKPMIATIDPNALEGRIVYVLSAKDPEPGAVIEYELVSGGENHFAVDKTKGIVSLKRKGIAKGLTSFILAVKAKDVGAKPPHAPQETQARLTIFVGDHPPQFYEKSYIFDFNERSSLSTKVGQVKAKAFNGVGIKYELRKEDGKASPNFRIEEKSGDIYPRREFKYEVPPRVFKLEVKAVEDPRTTNQGGTSVMVEVRIKDINNFGPVFPLSTYLVEKGISETTAIGTPLKLDVQAVDMDAGDNAKLTYSVSDDHFSVKNNNNKAIISVAKRLDYDKLPDHRYVFTLTAVDHGKPQKTGTTKVIVPILNENDEKPQFLGSTSNPRVDEDATPGTNIMTVQATDIDGSAITYSFKGNKQIDSTGTFEINRQTGRITLKKKVDKNKDFYTLTVVATDDGSCTGCTTVSTPKSSERVYTVEVMDINNHNPEFPDCESYKPTVYENAPKGTKVTMNGKTLTATDEDSGSNGKIEYFLKLPQDGTKPNFLMDKVTGVLTTARPFDREDKDETQFTVTVRAIDKGQPRLEGYCAFKVTVLDINDNLPFFLSTDVKYTMSTDSPTGPVFQVYAIDRDEGQNAKVTYHMKNTDCDFTVDKDSGVVTLTKKITTPKQCKLVIEAKDSTTPAPAKWNSVNVIVDVSDKVKPPVWTMPATEGDKQISIKENIPVATNIMNVSATGAVQYVVTAVTGRDFVYNIEGSSNTIPPFRTLIKKGYAELRTNDHLNFDWRSLSVNIRASKPSDVYSDVKLKVTLIDVNNRNPLFKKFLKNYKGSIAENIDPKNPPNLDSLNVIKVLAVDGDTLPPYRTVTYSLNKIDDYDKFTIDSKTGQIRAKVEFDREQLINGKMKTTYQVQVKAEDGAPSTNCNPPSSTCPPNYDNVVVEISITDQNDNKPAFLKNQYARSIPENTPIGGPAILSVTAKDADESSMLRFSIASGDSTNKFEMKSNVGKVKEEGGIRYMVNTGDIYVVQKLDYDKPPQEYKLIVRVFDGKYAAEATVTITLTDVNDNAPKFNPDMITITNVTEGQTPPPGGLFLQTMKATDVDKSDTSLVYSVLGQDKDYFYINTQSGELYLVKKLDREAADGSVRIWMVNVAASDGKHEGFAVVKIDVQDINDNAPIFLDSSLKGSVEENSPIGTLALSLQAKDYDKDKNAEVEYRLVSMTPLVNGKNPFKKRDADPTDGAIVTNVDNIDRDGTNGISMIRVVVEAKDRGNPSRSATATATVSILDVNDNDPRFTETSYKVQIPEELPKGKKFFSISATDPDISSQGQLTFTIDSDSARVFSIEDVRVTDSAVLKVFDPKRLDYENPTDRKKNVIVTVKDQTGRSTSTTVTVELLDVNDNVPTFTKPDQTVTMVENEPVATSVAEFLAVDKDTGLNGEISYDISVKTDLYRNLAIDSKGKITIAKPIDREQWNKDGAALGLMVVKVLAMDKGTPSLTGTGTLTIKILDENDNCPRFKEPYKPVVMENKAPPQDVAIIYAKDPDNSTNGPPFKFSEPTNSPTKESFKMKFEQGLDSGNGGARITTLKEFDREKQKYYLMPIIMADQHQFSCTNTLTITIGDENDNDHQPGHKEITIFNYEGKFKEVFIGTAYAEDPDDWDLKDKTFEFKGDPGPYFSINKDTGDIRLINYVHEGTYNMEITVTDSRRKKSVVSTVAVHSYTITSEPVYNAASFRLLGITAEQFIENKKVTKTPPDPKAYGPSMYTLFRNKIAEILKTQVQYVEIFAVQNCAGVTDKKCCDVRYSAHGSPYYKQAKMNGLMNDNKDAFQKILKDNGPAGATLDMTPVDLCLKETCEAGCTNVLHVGSQPKVVNTNSTSMVGVDTYVTAKCECQLKDLTSATVKCTSASCYNKGTCQQREDGFSCKCSSEFDGPRCQQTKHQFNGNGWAWYPALKQCLNSHTSISFATEAETGLILYNGPIRTPSGSTPKDFIAVELLGGFPKVTIDHGSGVGSVSFDGKLKNGSEVFGKLSDGKWHRLDIFRQGKFVRVVIDLCKKSRIDESVSGSTQDRYACEKAMTTPGFNRFININQPLQLGGRKNPNAGYPAGLTKQGFTGCVKDLVHDGELYDLHIGNVGEHLNSEDNCTKEAEKCGNCNHGKCLANLAGDLPNGKKFMCTCNPGYRGERCDVETTTVDFAAEGNSVLQWTLSQSWYNEWKDQFSSDIRVMFRTRQSLGVIMYFKSRDSINEFMLLRISNNHLVFQYNLGITDKELSLPYVRVSDGEWHSVHVQRFGKQVTLKMDIGEGKFYTSTPGDTVQHQLTSLEGTVLGGADEYRKSCMRDPRYQQGWFPVLSNETSEYATLVKSEGVSAGCPSNACAGKPNKCTLPFVCVDKWRLAICECPKGQVEKDKTCVYVDPCLARPCIRGVCVDLGKGTYKCNCEDGWEGDLCNIKKEPVVVTVATGMWVAIVVCILVLLLLVILFVIWIRRKPKDTKLIMEIEPDDDIRENVINYDEEGAGEEDFDGYDLSRLRKPREPPEMPRREAVQPLGSAPPGIDQPDVGNYIDDRLDDADNDPNAPPHDTLIEFNNEGGGSSAGSLSSLQSSSSDEDQNYDYLNDFGPRFAKLADMYGGGED